MKLEHEFYKLPLRFDVEQLVKELAGFAEHDWQKHPSDYEGNLAIPLISVKGEINDGFAGPMRMTPFLEQSPYLQQVIASFNSVFSRSRLMRLEGRHDVPLHSDINYHWWSRVRIHVPIVTTPDVIFHCGDQQVHMAPGEAWIFDAWKMHTVVNPSGSTRVHLVMDTTGSPEFWELAERAATVSSKPGSGNCVEAEFIPFQRTRKVKIQTEKYNHPLIMSPGEVEEMAKDIVQDVSRANENDTASVAEFSRIVQRFRFKWRTIWSVHGAEKSGWLDYQALINTTRTQLFAMESPLLTNQSVAAEVMAGRVLDPAFNPDLETAIQANKSAMNPAMQSSRSGTRNVPGAGVDARDRTGRNSPCPCGSGKKYKRCHGR